MTTLEVLCESCERRNATKTRRSGFESHPICDECAMWWPDHRLEPLEELKEVLPKPHVTALASAWRWYIDSLESMGRGVEAIPGWRRVEHVLDAAVDGLAFGIVLLWALRWWFALMFVALVIVT